MKQKSESGWLFFAKLLCKIGWHGWRLLKAVPGVEIHEAILTESCARCPTVRVRTVSAWDQVSGL